MTAVVGSSSIRPVASNFHAGLLLVLEWQSKNWTEKPREYAVHVALNSYPHSAKLFLLYEGRKMEARAWTSSTRCRWHVIVEIELLQVLKWS